MQESLLEQAKGGKMKLLIYDTTLDINSTRKRIVINVDNGTYKKSIVISADDIKVFNEVKE